MTRKIWITHGKTESCDPLPLFSYDSKPTYQEALDRYLAWDPLGDLQDEEGYPLFSFDIDELELPPGVDEDLRKLQALESAGVDNWSGYDFAMEDFYDDEEF